jgi:hypothetical protein
MIIIKYPSLTPWFDTGSKDVFEESCGVFLILGGREGTSSSFISPVKIYFDICEIAVMSNINPGFIHKPHNLIFGESWGGITCKTEISLPVGAHKAVAEVSKIGNYRTGALL